MICYFIINVHTLLPRRTNSLLHTLSFAIHSAGSPSACCYWFLFLVIHSLPCTVLIFFYLNAFTLSGIMIAHIRTMLLHAWQLQWRGWLTIWIELMCLISYLQLSFSISLLTFSLLPFLLIFSHTKSFFLLLVFYNSHLKWNKVWEIFNKTAVLYKFRK